MQRRPSESHRHRQRIHPAPPVGVGLHAGGALGVPGRLFAEHVVHPKLALQAVMPRLPRDPPCEVALQVRVELPVRVDPVAALDCLLDRGQDLSAVVVPVETEPVGPVGPSGAEVGAQREEPRDVAVGRVQLVDGPRPREVLEVVALEIDPPAVHFEGAPHALVPRVVEGRAPLVGMAPCEVEIPREHVRDRPDAERVAGRDLGPDHPLREDGFQVDHLLGVEVDLLAGRHRVHEIQRGAELVHDAPLVEDACGLGHGRLGHEVWIKRIARLDRLLLLAALRVKDRLRDHHAGPACANPLRIRAAEDGGRERIRCGEGGAHRQATPELDLHGACRGEVGLLRKVRGRVTGRQVRLDAVDPAWKPARRHQRGLQLAKAAQPLERPADPGGRRRHRRAVAVAKLVDVACQAGVAVVPANRQ